MKLRIGFVSNSSSSSFIFALPFSKKGACPTCGLSRNPETLAGLMGSDYEGIDIEYKGNVEGLLEFLADDLGYSVEEYIEEDWFKKEYKILQKLKKNMEVYFCSVGYSCANFCNVIKENKDVVVIREE